LPFRHCHGICKILNVEIESIDTVQEPGVRMKDIFEEASERPHERGSMPPDDVLPDIVLRTLGDNENPLKDAMPPRICPHGFRGKRHGQSLWCAFQALRGVSKDFKRVVEALPVWKEMKLDWLLRKAFKEEVRS
jgi:hypothetical protein